jgi:hypothetical protein
LRPSICWHWHRKLRRFCHLRADVIMVLNR